MIDEFSLGTVVIDTYHERVHAGRAFSAANLYLAVASAQFARMLIVVPSGSSAHAQMRIASDAKAAAYLRLVGSYSNVATLAPLNKNLINNKAPTVGLFTGGSLEVTSVSYFKQYFPAGSRSQPLGGVEGSFTENVFGPGTYAIDLQNLGTAAQDMAIELNWYEPKLP